MDALIQFLFPKGFHYPEIHVPAFTGHPLFSIGPVSYTSSHLAMLLVMAVLTVLAILATARMKGVPSGIQNFVEMVVEGLVDFIRGVGGEEAVKRVPLLGTLFLFILLSNWISVVPLLTQTSWLHKPTADYHVNFALALTVFVLYQFTGFRANGFGYVSRWINFSGFKEGVLVGVIMVIVGLIEFFSEVFRLLTLTLRLWGNMFGGEITLGVMAALLIVPGFALPFVGLELFVGLVQSLVFMLLTIMYFLFALESHDSHDESHGEGHAQGSHGHAPAHGHAPGQVAA
ncbi:MAG: F0F1 ATP synthase subunit A [Chloroflexi bacterium]|nr:F0F1 ATP synthase subunit A [Chloroflexota bacterium]